MKAIFIGIDGVLNHQHDESGDWTKMGMFGLSPDFVANLRTVLAAVPDAQLVVSSSWRRFRVDGIKGDWHDAFAEMLGIPRTRLEDAPTLHEFASPNFGAKGRAHDILLWLSEHGAGDPYVVIDDECKELKKWLGGCVVDCADDVPHGLTSARAEKAIGILQGKTVPSKPKQPACCGDGC